MKQNNAGKFTVLRVFSFGVYLLIATMVGCDAPENKIPSPQETKIGVLIVSHGSHSKNWRQMLLAIEDEVREDILKSGHIAGVRSAFMEYAGPSIATQLKEFDSQGYTDIIVVPLLLTVSSHSFDDIPTIVGLKQDRKTLETLRLENIEVYEPKAKVLIAPLLDYPNVLTSSVIRRVQQMSNNPKEEGIVLVAYGSHQYGEAWEHLLRKVQRNVQEKVGVECVKHAWCGHIVQYKSEPTERAIREVLREKQRALVIPLLVAVSENFQGKIIGGAIKKVDQRERIAYRNDAILPDENIHRWVIDISRKLASQIAIERGDAK